MSSPGNSHRSQPENYSVFFSRIQSGTLQDGTIFDSSHKRGKPFQFVFGTGRVIKGWDQGLVGMKVGGKRKLFVPEHLAYGEREIGDIIPAFSDLNFEIELLEVLTRD